MDAKCLRFFVAEFILSNIEGLLRMTYMCVLLEALGKSPFTKEGFRGISPST
jgi:hypothetical protein